MCVCFIKYISSSFRLLAGFVACIDMSVRETDIHVYEFLVSLEYLPSLGTVKK